MSAEVWYADSSALVKTAVAEPESAAIRRWLRGKRVVTCELARVEVTRAARAANPASLSAVARALRDVTLIRIDDELLDRAAAMGPPSLRSLDALHLAAAVSVGSELVGVVTYDRRMEDGARALGLAVEAPGRR